MPQDLKTIFLNHKGKISDKWISYITEWNELFQPIRQNPINLFEIGVHNGGSLEIWAKYFFNAKNIVGCDNNQACQQLKFSDSRISIILGDVNSDTLENKLREISSELNIIIDDGSHHSGDTIHSFSRYFKFLQPGGIYIIEDLHTSYWDEYNGGLNNPYSALSFLKQLTDITNFEHWRNNQSRVNFLSPYEDFYEINFEEIDLCSIHSIVFLNSLCIIHKSVSDQNKLGRRMVVGSKEEISEGYKKLTGTSIHDYTFDIKDDSHLNHFFLIDQNGVLKEKLADKEQSLRQLNGEVSNQRQANQFLESKIAVREEKIKQYKQKLHQTKDEIRNRERTIDQIKSSLETKNRLIDKQDNRIKDLQDDIIEEIQASINLKKKLKKHETFIKHKDAELEDRTHVIQRLKEILIEREEEIISYALDASWRLTRPLRKIQNLFKSGWPPKISLKRIIQGRMTFTELNDFFLIKQSGLFDFEYYLKSYADVRKSNINPMLHFIKYGWQEKRNPSSTFSIEQYAHLFPEVEDDSINPLVHYIKNNFQEDRSFSYYDSGNHHFRYLDLMAEESRLAAISHSANHPPQLPDIIILPIIDWDFRFQRPQQLACQLAKNGHRIFYLQTKIRSNAGNAPFIKLIQQNIYSVQIACGDHFVDVFSLLSDENADDFEDSFCQLRDHFLISSAVVMVDSPIWRKLAVRLRDNFSWKLIYDCMDLHSGFSINSTSIDLNEKQLLKASDMVIVSSHYLYEHVSKEENQIHQIPNGTDFEFFHQASKQIPNKELQSLSGPIIGYYGAIADWFDTELIGALAALHPEWIFVLIGSTYLADLEPLQGLSNIHLLGEKPYTEIPSYLSHFDVCLIPFKDTPLTQATNPVKMYEYLSAGKPVVAAKLHEISYFKDVVSLAGTIEEWEMALQTSLNEQKTPERLEARYRFARENTWEIRANLVEEELLGLYPKVSIIIVSYNNLEYTKRCLESIIQNTSIPNYEIIIVDNGSNNETAAYLNKRQSKNDRIQVCFNQSNLGFARANNQGFRKSSGAYLVFLNNDTLVTPGWLHRLQLCLLSTPKAGMVGPVTNAIGNEAKIDVPYEDISEINAFAAERARVFKDERFEIDMLALYCCLIPRDLYAAVGGLDERYEIGMFEDDDLAMKIRQKGLKLICAEDVFVHHFHGATFNKLSEDEYQKIFAENKHKFEEKWGVKWQPHQYRKRDVARSKTNQ